MQKVHSINLGGIIFQIEEDAYDLLGKYIDSVREYFKNTPEGKEISTDIEYRLGEMLLERIKNSQNIATKADVEAVISTMGQPKDFGYENEESATTTSSYGTADPKLKRKFFRDPDNKIIGGVCSGIGAYFDIEQVWVIRLIFLSVLVFLSGGTIFLVYVVLWIVVPEAKTSADRLAMKGEPVNFENIAKTFEDAYKKKDVTPFYAFIKKLGSLVETVIVGLIKLVSRIMGVGLLFVAFILFLSFFVIFSLKSEHIQMGPNGFSLAEVMNYVVPSTLSPVFIFGSALVVIGIVLFYLLLASLKLLGSKFHINKYVHIAAGLLLVAAMFSSLYIALKTAEEFSAESRSARVLNIDVKEDELKIVPFGQTGNTGENVIQMNDDDMGFIVADSGIYIRNINLEIGKSTSDDVELVYESASRGGDKKSAMANEKSILYKFSKKDDSLWLDTYFRLPKGSSWRCQEVSLKLNLPVGKRIKLDPFIDQLDVDIADDEFDYSEDDIKGKTLEMTDDGLKCVDCDEWKKHKKKSKKTVIRKGSGGEDDEELIEIIEEIEEDDEDMVAPPEPPAPPAPPVKAKEKK